MTKKIYLFYFVFSCGNKMVLFPSKNIESETSSMLTVLFDQAALRVRRRTLNSHGNFFLKKKFYFIFSKNFLKLRSCC